MAALHFRGTGLPDEQPVEFWVDSGVISTEPIPGADTVCESGGSFPVSSTPTATSASGSAAVVVRASRG